MTAVGQFTVNDERPNWVGTYHLRRPYSLAFRSFQPIEKCNEWLTVCSCCCRRLACNAGKQVGAKRALNIKQVWSIRFFLDREGRLRDRALFDLAIDSRLRGCDRVKITIGTLVARPTIRERWIVVQQKTGQSVQFEITGDARASLLAWLERRGGGIGDFAFPSRVNAAAHLSTPQYARLVDEWITVIGLRPEEYVTHSLRRTKASMIHKATGNLRAIQILLGQSKIENKVRHLGVDVDNALSLSEATEI